MKSSRDIPHPNYRKYPYGKRRSKGNYLTSHAK
jgi:hypothetical protein